MNVTKFSRTIAIAFLLTASAVSGMPERCRALGPGEPAKALALRSSSGETVCLNWQAGGSTATILEVLSIGCRACISTIPELNRIAESAGALRADLTAVCLGSTPGEVASFIAGHGIRYSVLADPEMTTFYLYNVPKVPQFFIIDSDGIIRYRCGSAKLKILEKKLEQLLKEGSRTGMQQPAPPVVLPDREGAVRDVLSESGGARTVLGFMRSDTPAAKKTLAILAGLRRKPYGETVSVFGIVTPGRAGSAPACTNGAAAVPLLIDKDGSTFERYNIGPSSALIQIDCAGRLNRYVTVAHDESPVSAGGMQYRGAGPDSPPDAVKAALQQTVPDIRLWESVPVDSETVYAAILGAGKRVYVRVVHAPLRCEVCSDVRFFYAIDQQGIFRAARLLEPLDYFGKPIDAGDFLDQFIGKSFHEQFYAGANVDVISGATKSCSAIIREMNKAEAVFRGYTADPAFDAAFRSKICFMQQAVIEWAINLYMRNSTSPEDLPPLSRVSALCPGGTLPRCPAGGTYKVIRFNNIPRVLCTHHGLDPEASAFSIR